MAVDTHGFITLPATGQFQPAFLPVISAVTGQLKASLPELIHSLYVYGSVAQGRAVSGSSDLDITVIFHHPPSPETLVRLAAVQSGLEQSHPVVSKIDFDCGWRDNVLHPENTLSWRYWLKHHCVCICGEDLSQRFQPFKPSAGIAIAVNGDFMTVTDDLVTQMLSSADIKTQLLLQRAAARKIIRATSILRHEEDDDWPDTLQEHAGKFNARYPALAPQMNYLLARSIVPQQDFTDFSTRIMAFTHWLDRAFTTRQMPVKTPRIRE